MESKMAERFAGVAFIMVDGDQFRLRGNLTVSPSPVERTMIAGQDVVHGYQELPRVPYIECDLSAMPELSLEGLLDQTDVTVVAELANGISYALSGATVKGGFEENTRDGQLRVRWEGLVCEEIPL
jgi:Phage tail tube protein